MLARLNSIAFLAADAYTNQQHGRTEDVQTLFDSVFHLDSIRNILSRQSHSPTELEYVVDIGEDGKLVVYGPDNGENAPPMPLLTTGIMDSALPVALEADANYHAELVPDKIAEMLCGTAADGDGVSLDERLLAYIFDRIISHAFPGPAADWRAVDLVAFDHQNFHAHSLLSLQQRLFRGLSSPSNAQFELLFNIDTGKNVGRDGGEVAISVALRAILSGAVSRGSERLLLWNAAVRVAAATPANSNTQQAIPALRPRYVDWVHVGDVPSSPPTHSHHNGRARHHFLLLQGSTGGLIDDLHTKLQATSADVQRHDISSFSPTMLLHRGTSRQESTTTVIVDIASIATADNGPGASSNLCQELCERLATTSAGARVVLATQGVLAVTGYEDRQVEADSAGAAELVGRYHAGSQEQLDVWQVDVDARAATSEGADALSRLLLLPDDDENNVFKSARGGIVALRDGSRLFEPAWVESGRVVDAAGDEEALLRAPFAACFREREQVFEMDRLLADACTEALRSVVDPATFERAFAKLDRLAEQSLVAAVASLGQQDLQHSVPPYLKQLCQRYSRQQYSSHSALTDASRLQAELQELYTECPPLRPSVALLGNVLGRHRDVLLGRLAPLDVLFGKNDAAAAANSGAQQAGGGGAAAEVYDEAVLARVHKRVVEATISHLCTLASRSSGRRRLRILEVGAGTGGTALPLLRLLQQHHPGVCAEYAFTDLGAHFVHAFARRHRTDDFSPFLRTQTLDAGRHPSLQGVAAGEYDVVVCVNVLHATPSVAAALAHVHALLAPGGVLVLQEITTQASAFLDATFGLTEGWWAARPDDAFRPGGYPTLPPRAWQHALGRTGFAWSACTPAGGALDQQAVFVAQKSVPTWDGGAASTMRLREESDGWYVLAGEQGDLVTALAAQELIGTFDARRLIWVRFGVGGAASYAQDEEDRAFQLAHEAGVDLQVFEGTRGSEIVSPEVQSLLKGGDVRGVVWVTKDSGPQSSTFTTLQRLHVDLDRLDRIPRRLVILHGIGYEGDHLLQDPLESFVRFRRGRLGLPTLLARWHLGEESGLPSAVVRSTITAAIRSCDFRSKKVAVLDFIGAWKAARNQQQTTKTIAAKASAAGRTISAANKTTNGVKEPTAIRASNVPSIDTIIAVVIAEAEALLGSSGSVDADDPLMQAGIDSLAVVELRAGLKRLFPLAPLPSTYIYEYATARAIAEAIATMLAEVEEEQEEERAEAARAAPPSLTTAAPAVRDISPPATVPSSFPTTAPHGVADALSEDRGNKIAVIAMDCRMPGGMNSSDEFWEGLKLGRDAMVDIPLSRFDVDEVYDGDVDALAKGKTYVRRGGFLERAEHFDRSRFSIPEVQLQQMDPQQRILLETVDSALTDAGYSRKDMAGRDASVYIGVSCKDWAKVAPLDGAFIGTGAAAAIVSNRISFELGLSGTSMSIDTACSSSLVAVDLAVQALRLGRTDMAVAGGVNMILHPDPYVVFCQNKMLSPDGLCKTFDRDAKGYVRSEGCGVVILKRLSDALRDGDPVLGVITGSCSNQDGRSTNISAPSGKAQQEVVQRALRDAGRRPDEVDFVELHGTGTALGDPVEVHSLKAVFGAPTRKRKATTDVVRTRPLYLGAVKTNIGHPEAAAGIAGLIKCVNVVQQRQVPPNIHLENINPGIEFEGFDAARLPDRVEDVGRGPDRAVVAGCSSFGFGGTNVHVIVESPPAHARSRAPKPVKKEVKKMPDVEVPRRARTDDEEKLVIAFTGQGSQFASMAKELYRDDSVFAATIDRCVKICSPWIAPEDLRNALLEPNAEGTEAITPAYASQASLFVMEYAIYQTLVERGLHADVVLGHSIGEIVAAVVSGCLSLEDGLRLVCQRGIIMEQADVEGTMYAIMLPHTTIQAAIDELGLGGTAAVAAINGSNLTTVAGLHESLQRLLRQLGEGVTSAPLKVSRPFHSPLLRPCMQEFAERIDGLNASAPTTVRFWSTVTAAEVTAAPDVNHWVRHALQAVLFEPTVRAVSEAFAGRVRLLEVGPKSVLYDMMRRWARVPPGLPAPCALLGSSSVATKSGITLATLQAAVKANEEHFGKRDDLFEDGEEGECDPSGSKIVLVGQGRREGFFPWRRGYHALITCPEILQLDVETRAVRFRVNHRTIQLVADHVVRGRPILPGAAVFDLALGGYQVLHNLHPLEALPMELRDAVISRPVVLAADMEPPWLQLTYHSTDGTVQVMSAADPSHEFVEHARATVVRVEPTQRHQRVRLATIQHRCTNAVDVTDLRSKLAARGLAYGPQFQAMVSAHRRDGECLAELRLPASGSSGYVVHPGVLDSAMQTCAATLSSMAGKDAFAVGSLGRLRVRAFMGEHRSNAVVRVWSRVVSSTADCYEANVDVCDTHGNVLLSLEALRLVRVSSQVALVASSRCLYLTEWAPLQPAPGQSLCAASSARLPEKTAIDIDQVLGIVTGTNFARRGPVAALRDALRTACGAGSILDVALPLTTSEKPIHTLLYVCSPTETAYAITSQLCRLFQAILDTTVLSELRSIVVVTLGSQFVLEDDACSSPESSAAWGLLRSARLELPQLRLVTLDVDSTASTWKQALAVLDAALDASEDEVAWRDGRRYVPRLTDPGFQGTEAEAIDVMRPAFDFSIETALPAALDLNTAVPVDVDDAELARVRTGYALVNSLALQSLIQGAASVSSEADVVPLVQQLWRRYRNMPASSVQSELVPPDLGDASAWIDSAIKDYPEVTSELVMLKSLYGQHGAVFRGERDPLELLFRTDRHTETEGIYSESFYARYYNSVVTYVLSALVQQQQQQPQNRSRKLRILEVGAGSGSTTRRMLETAAALEIEVDYHFTDISETFIRKASAGGKLAAPGARVTYGVFDAERDPRLQGLASSSFDLIVAVNVIHATRVLSETMTNLRRLLRPRGVVVLSEFTRPSPMTDASFGMTEGWWRFDDKDLRPEYPLMEAARWESLLLSTGFNRVRTLENPKAGESQAVIVAQASSQEDNDSRDHEQEEHGKRGVYIISGGTGGIGLLTAIVLIERGCQKVYLLSRSGKVSSNSTHLWDRLMAAAQPDQVVKVACDVSNGVQVAEVFASIRERGEWVEGIVHSAGALRDAMLRNQSPATISTVFAAKVEALRHLHSCSLDEPLLRQFVIYSSCAALLGSPGQSNHAAANAFLDSFTAYRRTCGLPALSIQWGTVSGIGEAARKGANKLAVKFGHGQVSETEAEGFLKAVFASDHARTLSGPMCISPFNWSTFTKMRTRVPSLVSAFSVIQKPIPPRPAGTAQATKAAPVSNARGNAAVSLLEKIQSCVEATVGTRMPSASSTFFDVGMDSLSAIEFRNRLQSSLGAGVKLSASLVFDYPTLARLQEYLEGLPELMGIMNETEQLPVAPPATAASTVETPPQQQLQSPTPNISCVIRNAPQVVDKVISIVGMDARLPGADSVEDLWNLLLSDEDPFRDIPFSRWDLDDNFYAPKTAAADGKAAGRSYVRQGSFLRPDQLEWFDNSFFGISNAEARTMDPNQRLLLEVSYQALADAGYTRDSLRGQNVGVFVGFMNYDQFFLTGGGGDKGASAFTASSASPAVLSNRVSHVLGLEGPSCTLDTACSASLYALHTAMGALRSGQCDAAVVAGVNVMMSPAAFVAECAAGMLSASQRCRPLDDGADGFARGEGCVAVVLQRRADAVAQGRHVHADILGSSIGHDGTTVNLTSPNGPAQARVVKRALQDAGVSPESIAFVEGHLTGTVLGDPIEFSALKSVFGTPAAQENRSAPLHLGAIKSNLGHLEGVAGVAGLVKAVLSLRHRVLPPIAHLKKLNRHLDFEGFKVNVPGSGSVGLVPSSSSSPELRCGVSSFGFSGANAHIVLEAASASQRCLVARKRHVFSRNHFPLRRGGSHALLGHLPAGDSTLTTGGEHEVLIGHRLFALLEQHVVRGVPTVPGTMLVELAASVVAGSGPSPSAHLQEIVFAAPFTVSAPRSKTMSIAHEVDGQFTISWAGVDEEDESHITAYGRLKGPADSLSTDERHSMLDRLRRHQDACKQVVDIKSVWQKLEDVGIRYTGLFRSLQHAYTSINERAALAYGNISLAENGEDGFLAHPALLDSAMQLCAAVVLAKLSTTTTTTEEQSRGGGGAVAAARTFLPFAMTGVRFWAPRPRESRRREFVATAEVVSVGAAEVKARLSVFDDATRDPVFDIEEIVFRPAGAKGGEKGQGQSQSQNKLADPLHTVCWARMPAAPELEKIAQPCVLVVEDEQDRDALASELPSSVTVALLREYKASEGLAQTLYYLPSVSSAAADLCTSALELVNTAVEAASPGTPANSSLWVLTRASQVAPVAHPQQAALWGMMRSIVLEDTRAVSSIGLVDLVVAGKSDGEAIAHKEVLKLLGRLKAPSRPLPELAWDAETDTWFTPQMVPDRLCELDVPTVATATTGLDSLEAVPLIEPEGAADLGEEQVSIRVGAVGINFHDVLFAAGGLQHGSSALGADFAGSVEAVGSGVKHISPGDTVFGMAEACMRSVVRCNACLVRKVPEGLSLVDAAALPTVFATAYHCLVELAELQPGQTVLVHTATGGLGHLLVGIAQARGARVVATAGSEEKRAYLRDRLGLEGSRVVSTTRDARAFAAELKHVAGQVDVAINTLSGDYIPETLRLLKPGGKFIETGKVAIWSHDKVAASRPDITYRIVDLDITGSASVDLMDAFLSRLAEGMADGSVRPPPVTTFDYPAQLRDAFRYVRTAKHIGKVVLRMPSATLPRTIAAANTSPGFSPPEAPVTFDQSRYQEGIEQVAQFASRQLRAAAGDLAEHEVDGRWRKLYGRYAHHEAEDGEHLGVEEIIETWPEVRPEARLVGLMQGKVEDLFRGRVEAPTLLFSEAAMEVVEGFYVGSLALDYYNTVLKETLASLLRDRPSGRKLRILEVGAGTGATTAKLLPVLESVDFEYVFTDVSSVFLKKAKRDIASHLPASGSMVFDILDIEVDPCAQGFQPAQFDIVLAANCIHATRRMKETVANMRSLLRPSGVMLLFESTRQSAISDCTFGFTDGWWRFEDFDLRPDYPLLSFDTWNSLLMSNGFVSVDRVDRLDGALESSAIIVARNSSTTEDSPEDTSTMIRGDAAYLVTGGNSGLGLVAARTLLDAGARHLVLLSRSGAIKEDDSHLWHRLHSAAANIGAKIEHLPCDVGDGAALEQTLASLREQGCPEIRGVIHAAGLLDDAPFRQQSKKTLDTVIAPKVAGAISLRKALVPQPDFILLFSSAAGLLGSPTQSNHCAANATLDALAAQWRHEGLPAMSLAWGMVLGLGTLRRQPPGRAAIERLGGISPDLAYRTICAAIAATAGCRHHSGYLLCSPIQWSKLLTNSDGTEPDAVNSPQSGHRQLFSTYRKHLALQRQLEPPKRKPARKAARPATSKSTSSPKPTQQAAAAVVPDLDSITATIRSILADVTGTSMPSSEPDPRFEDHGVDSLSSMELGNRLNAAFAGLLAISPMALNGFPTLSSLSQHIHSELLIRAGGNNNTTAPEEEQAEQQQQQQQNLVDLNAVADDGHPDTPVGIVIHGGAGEVHHVKQLAARLPFRVVGVRQTDDVPADSVSAMAAHYIRILQREGLLGRRRADGTVRRRVQLMGYSFGGCVAWEMARLLEMQQGGSSKQPERLLLLDGGPTTDVSMEHVLGCRLESAGGGGGDDAEEEEGVGALSIRLMGALLLASGAKVVGTADIVGTLQRVGLVKNSSSSSPSSSSENDENNSGVEKQRSFDLDLITRTTNEIISLIPPSLRGAPLQRLTDLFAANMRAYDGYLAFHAAGKAPAFDGPVWVARSKLPRDDEERRRAQLWLDSDHYAFMDRVELAEAVAGLVVA